MVDDARPEPAVPPPAPAPIPDLGFFTQPSVPAPSSPSRPRAMPAQSRFGGPPASQFGPPVSQFGTPAPRVTTPAPAAPAAPPPAFAPPGQFGPPAGQFGPPAAPPPGQPFGAPDGAVYGPPPGRRGLPAWVIVLIAVPVALVIVGTLAAVAIPVFLNQRAKAELSATTVTIPDSVGGLTRAPMPPELEGQLEKLRTATGAELPDPQVAVFTDGKDTHNVFVMAGRLGYVASDREQEVAVRDALRGATDSAAGVATVGTPEQRPPGALGGRVTCMAFDPKNVDGEMCVAMNATSLVMTVDMALKGSAELDPTVAEDVREAVVRQTP